MADAVDALNAIDDKAAAEAFSPSGAAPAPPDRRAECRPDGAGGLLPQLPVRLGGRGGGRRQGDRAGAIYGMPYDQWKAEHQAEATPEQLAAYAESVKKNR